MKYFFKKLQNNVRFKQIDTAIFICIIAVFFTLLPLFRPGFFSMHDDEQIGRLYDLDLAIHAGHIPPRIAPNLGFGYGYPFFNFYPSFVYYVGEIYKVLGFSYIDSTKLMIATGFVFAALFMYAFAIQYLSKTGAIIAAIAYTYVPYHSVDVYVRGALPEFFSFAFVAGLFWSLTKLQKDNRIKNAIVVGIIGACFILTHNLIALMSGFFIVPYFFFLLFTTKNKKTFFISSALGGVLALSLSAYFWLPSYAERNYTLIEILTKDLADYSQHFVYIRQFWDSPWGYGGSLYGLYDGLSFQIGKLHIIAVFIAAVFLFIKKKKDTRNIFILFIGLFFFAAYLCTFHSKFIWDSIPQLAYVQFPWRFLLFTGFFSSFLLGSLFSLNNSKNNTYAAVIFAVVLIFFYKDNFVPKEYYNVSDSAYTSPGVIRWKTSNMAAEYVPKGFITKKSTIGTTVVDIKENEIAKNSFVVRNGLYQEIKVVEDKPQTKEFVASAPGPITLQINTYSFPGWKVFIDNNPVSYTDNNKFKLITVLVPAGTHTVKALFTDTPVRLLGNSLTIFSILTLLIYSIIRVFYSLDKRKLDS
jgi:hypothetical protein